MPPCPGGNGRSSRGQLADSGSRTLASVALAQLLLVPACALPPPCNTKFIEIERRYLPFAGASARLGCTWPFPPCPVEPVNPVWSLHIHRRCMPRLPPPGTPKHRRRGAQDKADSCRPSRSSPPSSRWTSQAILPLHGPPSFRFPACCFSPSAGFLNPILFPLARGNVLRGTLRRPTTEEQTQTPREETTVHAASPARRNVSLVRSFGLVFDFFANLAPKGSRAAATSPRVLSLAAPPSASQPPYAHQS